MIKSRTLAVFLSWSLDNLTPCLYYRARGYGPQASSGKPRTRCSCRAGPATGSQRPAHGLPLTVRWRTFEIWTRVKHARGVKGSREPAAALPRVTDRDAFAK